MHLLFFFSLFICHPHLFDYFCSAQIYSQPDKLCLIIIVPLRMWRHNYDIAAATPVWSVNAPTV